LETPDTAACALVKVATLQRLQGIAGAKALNVLPEKVGAMAPTLRAARELAKVPEADRAGVVQTVAGDGKPVTAAAIKRHLHDR
jgi:hypothetical protein